MIFDNPMIFIFWLLSGILSIWLLHSIWKNSRKGWVNVSFIMVGVGLPVLFGSFVITAQPLNMFLFYVGLIIIFPGVFFQLDWKRGKKDQGEPNNDNT